MPLLIGADPELFLKKKGQFISAHGLIPGNKRHPYKVDLGAVQVDGMAAEINIQPASSPDEFVHNMHHVMKQLRDMIDGEMEFAKEASAHFELEYMMAQPDSSREQGCDPDYNAYSLQANQTPHCHPTMRAAGGHFHIGWGKGFMPYDEQHFKECARLARQQDYTIGLVSVIHDKDKDRKTLYGKAGAFRPKSYGMEYRTASNYWIWDEELMKLSYENACLGYNWLADGRDLFAEYGERAKNAIDTDNKPWARELCEEIGIPIHM